MKEIILSKTNGKYKIPLFISLNNKNKLYKFEYNGKLYDKEIKTSEKEVRQISLLVEALNIKNRKKQIEFIYDKSCDLLDDDFYGKNVCEFKDGKCIYNRIQNSCGGGCCCSSNKEYICEYLTNNGCKVRCLTCKFHVCKIIRKKGFKYNMNDIYMIKYIFSVKQKIILSSNFFMSKEECLKDLYRNSLFLWIFTKSKSLIKNPEFKNKK